MVFEVIIGRKENEKKIFGKKGLAYLGKSYVKMEDYTSLSNNVFLDIAKSHIILISGKRGSGKSYTLGVLAESISEKEKEDGLNISSLIFDTMGIFWTMKFRNFKDRDLLAEWGLESKNVPINIYAPSGYFEEYNKKGIPVDKELKIKISEITKEEWIELFNLDYTKQEAVLISNVISFLEEKKSLVFNDIFKEIEKNPSFNKEIKNSVIALFNMAKSWGIFDEKEGTPIKEIVKRGQTTVIDLSMYPSISQFNIRGLVIGLICKKLFKERMISRKEEEVFSVQRAGFSEFTTTSVKDSPLVWVFIDEAHEFLPKEGKTPATDSLIQLLREGRQPGISLVLATQQPGKIHTDAMTQSDIVISHLLTAEQDIKALNEIMQSYVYEGIKKKMNELPKLNGSAIVLDDNSERIYSIKVRPRYTFHGGETPSAIQNYTNLL